MNKLESKEQQYHYTWWDHKLYLTLSKWWKKAYIIAARLHDWVYRKDGKSPYLEHINRSIRLYRWNRELFWYRFNTRGMERNINLHDCWEDHPDWIKEIRKAYWDKVLIKVLWMSEPNKIVRKKLPIFISWLSEKIREKYTLFLDIIDYIDYWDPSNEEGREWLKGILPKGDWIKLWDYYKILYDTESGEERKKDIIAEWIFQWMIANMPLDCFVAKSCERLDNLGDIEWLKDEKWGKSYQKTLFTTIMTYLPRLKAEGYTSLHDSLLRAWWVWRRELSKVIPTINDLLRD